LSVKGFHCFFCKNTVLRSGERLISWEFSPDPETIHMLPIDTNIFPQKKGVYIVGGSIRDLLYGRTPCDYDLAVQGDPAIFAGRLASRTSGHIVEFGKHGQIMRRVVTGDYFFDIMPVNGASIDEDVRRRDFTINAMAVDVSSGKLIDQLGGQQDLAAKKIRMVSADVFRKDPVRLIRAYRLAAAFDFTIDAATQTTICRDANLIRKSAGERIREEFFKILQCDKSHDYLSRMAHSGLLFSVFPELLNLKNYRFDTDDPRGLFEQTLDSYYHLEKLLDPGDQFMRAIGSRLFQDNSTVRAMLLKCAVLFHDIGKPARQTLGDITGIIHFYGHASTSAAMAQDICQRLRFSRRQTNNIEFIIRNHCRPFFLFRAQQKKASAQKAFIRFFLKCGNTTPDVLLHSLAEFRGQKDTGDPGMSGFADFILTLIREYYSVLRPRASLPRPLNGNDLIKEFGLKPSALFQRILQHVAEERLARPALTRKQALKLVEELLEKQNRSSFPTSW